MFGWTTSRQIQSAVETLFRKMSFYAVARGHKVGIYNTWPACESQVKGFQNARYKKFKTHLEAENFIKEFGGEAAAEFLKKITSSNQNHIETSTLSSVQSPKKLKNSSQDFWPESDGDSFQQDAVTDDDLLNALYEVEGLPDKASASNTLKRKALSDAGSSSSSKILKHTSNVAKIAGYVNKGQYEFPIDEEGFVIVYTDGSCLNNGQENARAGFGVYFGKDHPLNTAQPVSGRVTNNVGEIQAATHAIQIARDVGIQRLCISTDSQFLINAATSWIKAWKRKNWRLKNGDPVKNVVDFKVLDLLLEDDKIIVKWNYVKGHASIEGNDMADKLARDGAAEYARLHLKQ